MALDDVVIQRCATKEDYLSAPLWDSVVFTIPEADLASAITSITDEDPMDFIVHGIVHLAPQGAAQLEIFSSAKRRIRRPAHEPGAGDGSIAT